MRALLVLAAAASALVGTAGEARATAELKLQDGRVLVGSDLEVREGVYLLTVGHEVVTIPLPLVKEMRLTGTDLPGPSGLKVARGEAVPGTPEAPPRPSRAEQLAAFGRPPARFPDPPIAARWRPEDGLAGRDATNFRPSRWPTSPIDPVWTPRSAWNAVDDVTEFNPARWYRPPVATGWRPRDGFGPTAWFPPVAEPEE